MDIFLMEQLLKELGSIFEAAEEFVRVHYACTDQKDKGIKILATMNQIIELKCKRRKSRSRSGSFLSIACQEWFSTAPISAPAITSLFRRKFFLSLLIDKIVRVKSIA